MLTHNPHSFLTGDDAFLSLEPIERTADRFQGQVVFEHHHEGFIGIPHGGLPMGLALDAWRRTGLSRYPARVSYKFGGSGIAIGDTAQFEVERDGSATAPGITVKIAKPGDKTPYLSARIDAAQPHEEAYRPPADPSPEFRPLPYYRNCFVCGHHRGVEGLRRRFRLHEVNGTQLVTTLWGSKEEDLDRAGLFLIGKDELHPAVLVSIFDENTAWGGFMKTGKAGLSVRLDMTLVRPVAKYEKLMFIGWSAGIRGNPRSPRFFKAEGVIASLANPQNPEPVAWGNGEWIIVQSYTEQIKKNLLPEGDWSWIFFGSGNGTP